VENLPPVRINESEDASPMAQASLYVYTKLNTLLILLLIINSTLPDIKWKSERKDATIH
jgi:hypothetical protein